MWTKAQQTNSDFPSSKISDLLNALAVKLEGLPEEIAEQAHPVGLCQNCGTCVRQSQELKWDALEKIEERAPGTKERVALWQLNNTPLDIVITDDELRALGIQVPTAPGD